MMSASTSSSGSGPAPSGLCHRTIEGPKRMGDDGQVGPQPILLESDRWLLRAPKRSEKVPQAAILLFPQARPCGIIKDNTAIALWRKTVAELLQAFGLSSPAGLNAYLALLIAGVAARVGMLTFAEPYQYYLTNVWVLGALAVLLAIEVLVD